MPPYKVEQTMMSIKELKESHYDDVDWLTLINSFMFSSKSKKRVNEDQMIVTNPTFISKLRDLLKKAPSKTVANAIGFSLLNNVLSYKSVAGIKTLDILSKSRQDNVSLLCDNFVSQASLFYKASEALYAKKYFSPEQKTKADDLLNIALSEVYILLEDLQWMDNTTKEKAIQKVESMIIYIGYNKEVLDKTKMTAYHDSFLESMNSTNFVHSQVQIYSLLNVQQHK